jgi:type VI secretion system secreted protein Hcp
MHLLKTTLLAAIAGLGMYTMPLEASAAGGGTTVHIFAECDGNAIRGNSSVKSMERADSIETLTFSVGTTRRSPDAERDGLGETRLLEATFQKQVDRSSPQLVDALLRRKVCSIEARFYRPSPRGDGTTEMYYTVALEGASIIEVQTEATPALDPALGSRGTIETVTVAYRVMTITYEVSGEEAHYEAGRAIGSSSPRPPSVGSKPPAATRAKRTSAPAKRQPKKRRRSRRN